MGCRRRREKEEVEAKGVNGVVNLAVADLVKAGRSDASSRFDIVGYCRAVGWSQGRKKFALAF